MLRFLSRIFGREAKFAAQHTLSESDLEELEARIGYHFTDRSTLLEALTHRSFLHYSTSPKPLAYERLEFLGDSVLGLVVAEELFDKYADMSEGELTKNKSLLVNKSVLAHVGNRIGLGRYILLSPDEDRAGGRQRPSILADCLEALIGAVYHDGGIDAARVTVRKLISFNFDQTRRTLKLRNYKGELLELLQSRGNSNPRYSVISEEGPDHRKTFTVEVFIDGKKLGTGRGISKKSAEQSAAAEALTTLQQRSEKGH